MSEETVTPSTPVSARRALRRTLAAVALVVLGFVAWHYWIELPAERRAAAELAAKRATNARTIPDLKLDLVWIAPGEFLMGSEKQFFLARWLLNPRAKLTGKPNLGWSADDERPVTWVTLTRPFWLGRTEVTQAQWTAVMGSNQSHFKGSDLPVEMVSWDDAMEFCLKLTERERAANRLPTGYAYTLPTEAQWEFACRAGTTGYYAGDLNAMAWYDGNHSGTTHPVATKLPNAWGLSDMNGNIWEWCLDWYAPYLGGEVSNPHGSASGTERVFRGGGWNGSARYSRSAYRFHTGPGFRSLSHGFRVALVQKSPSTTPLFSPNLTAP